MIIEGGCNCRAIRYQCEGEPLGVAQCHCCNCQRQSGSAFSVNLVFRASAVSHSGDLAEYRDDDTFSGNSVLRRFCATCGSPIFSQSSSGTGLIVVKAGTLDDPGSFVPTMSLWETTALPWLETFEPKRRYERNS
jgi:hypothetical protein